MFNSPIARLIRDIVLAVLAIVIFTWIAASTGSGFFQAIGTGFLFAGVPFGWRWWSKIFTTFSLPMFFVKLLLSVILGWIAIFVVLGKDIYEVVAAKE